MQAETTPRKAKSKTNYKFELWYNANKNSEEAFCDWENYKLEMLYIGESVLTFKQWLKENWENGAWDKSG